MADKMTEEQVYEEAKKRVKAKRDFYGHLVVYVLVNIILVIIWAFPSGGGYPWFLWPLGCWGFFVLLNFLNVFVLRQHMSDTKAIEKEAERIRKQGD